MKKIVYSTFVAIGLIATSSAVTLQLSAFGAGGQVILGNGAGAATNGMSWGILVDTNANGFADFSTVTTTGSAYSNGFLGGSDDFLILSSNLTAAFGGSNGSATQLQFNLGGDVTGDENYGIFWFSSVAAGATIPLGSSYGLITNPALVVPTSNSAVINTTAIRSATVNSATQIFGIPEPSSALLGALGALGLLRRRRN